MFFFEEKDTCTQISRVNVIIYRKCCLILYSVEKRFQIRENEKEMMNQIFMYCASIYWSEFNMYYKNKGIIERNISSLINCWWTIFKVLEAAFRLYNRHISRLHWSRLVSIRRCFIRFGHEVHLVFTKFLFGYEKNIVANKHYFCFSVVKHSYPMSL